MSQLSVRGGVPYIDRQTVDLTGRKFTIPAQITYLKLRNLDATNTVKVFFTKADFDADNEKHVLLPVSAAATPYGAWEGPVEVREPEGGIWMKANVAACAIELVAFMRRG